MVMSEEAGEGAALKLAQQTDNAGQPSARRVSEKEKDLAGEASKAFSSGEYSRCLAALEKLEVDREIFRRVFLIVNHICSSGQGIVKMALGKRIIFAQLITFSGIGPHLNGLFTGVLRMNFH